MGTLTPHLVTRDPAVAATWYGAALGARGPRGVSGAFVDVFRARNSPRHSPSYRLTTLIAGIESVGVRATSVRRAPGT
jgi:hypothetical protein